VGIAGFVLETSGTQDAIANGDTRTLLRSPVR
jgi:hypothetical protein